MTYDRASMIETIRRHGWRTELAFGCQGPVLLIRGNFHGMIEMPVPVRLDDDHQKAMGDVYSLVGKCLEIQGKCGRA